MVLKKNFNGMLEVNLKQRGLFFDGYYYCLTCWSTAFNTSFAQPLNQPDS